jgi:hypothetical protein
MIGHCGRHDGGKRERNGRQRWDMNPAPFQH